MTAAPPRMEPRELKDGSGWYVHLTWPTGAQEDIDVSSETEAIEWVRNRSSAWLAKGRPGHDRAAPRS